MLLHEALIVLLKDTLLLNNSRHVLAIDNLVCRSNKEKLGTY